MDNKILRNVTYSTCALSVILFLLGANLQFTIFSAIVFANSFMLMTANNGSFMGLKKNTAVTITILYLIIFDYFFIFELLPNFE
jgi:hypothetical protein